MINKFQLQLFFVLFSRPDRTEEQTYNANSPQLYRQREEEGKLSENNPDGAMFLD